MIRKKSMCGASKKSGVLSKSRKKNVHARRGVCAHRAARSRRRSCSFCTLQKNHAVPHGMSSCFCSSRTRLQRTRQGTWARGCGARRSACGRTEIRHESGAGGSGVAGRGALADPNSAQRTASGLDVNGEIVSRTSSSNRFRIEKNIWGSLALANWGVGPRADQKPRKRSTRHVLPSPLLQNTYAHHANPEATPRLPRGYP